MPTPTGDQIAIEPIEFEVLAWVPRNPEIYSRAEVLRQTGEYRAAIPSKIANWQPIISPSDIADIEDATRRLLEFEAYAQKLLGHGHSYMGPMSAILLRTESASSSQIEQLTTSAKQLALAEIEEGEKLNALTVLGNVRAMELAIELSPDLSESSVLRMHRALMGSQYGRASESGGRFRAEQVWIGRGQAGPRQAEFVPPHHERITEAMADLVSFMRRQDLPVLLQAAIAHSQFETIHPFTDGNGRTGRALVHSILRNKELVKSTLIPLSAGLLSDVEAYFTNLGNFRAGDAGPITRQFCQAIRLGASFGVRLVNDVDSQLQLSKNKLAGMRSDAAAWQLLPLLISNPVLNLRYVLKSTGLGQMAALRALRALTERGVLLEITGKTRSRVWMHKGIIEVLDAYAGELRRPAAAT